MCLRGASVYDWLSIEGVRAVSEATIEEIFGQSLVTLGRPGSSGMASCIPYMDRERLYQPLCLILWVSSVLWWQY